MLERIRQQKGEIKNFAKHLMLGCIPLAAFSNTFCGCVIFCLLREFGLSLICTPSGLAILQQLVKCIT